MTYAEKLNILKKVKEKHRDSILSLKGVHGIGLRVNEFKIVVYVHEITPETLKQIPFELDGIVVEADGCTIPVESGYTGGSKVADETNSGYGTFGSSWYSHKYKMPVGITNNHVANIGQAFGGRDKTEPFSIPITTESNGYTANPTGTRTNRPCEKPTITSVEPAIGGKRGDVITINGTAFGGNNKGIVLVNGIKQDILYWFDSSIVIRLTGNLKVGTAELVIMVMGVLGKSKVTDWWLQFNVKSTKELIDFTLQKTGNFDTIGRQLAERNADVAIFSLTDVNDFDKRITQHGSNNSSHYNFNYYATGREKLISGVCLEPRENLPVQHTGMTAGTVYGIIKDAHADLFCTYLNLGGINVFYNDAIYWGFTTFKDGTPATIYPNVGGMSGSSLLVASVDELMEFYDHYNLAYPDRAIMEAAFKDGNGIQDIYPEQFIGNTFALEDDKITSVADKAVNWIDKFQLEPLNLAVQTTLDEPLIYNSSHGFETIATLATPDILVSALLSANVGGTAEAYAFQIKEVESFELVDITASDHLNLSFDLGGGDILAQDISLSAKGGIIAQVMLTTAPDLTISFTASAKGGIGAFAQHTVNPFIYASVNFTSTCGFNINTDLLNPLLTESYFQAKVQGNALSVLWDIIAVTQYENIYFEITRTQDINTEITKSIDLNLAV